MEAKALKSLRKKRRNLLLVLITALFAVFTAGMLCACATVDDEQKIIEAGYIHEVTYDANGGDFHPDPSIFSQYEYVRVQEDSLTVEPGYRPAGAGDLDIINVPTRSGYDLLGWKQVLFDDDGNEIGLSEDYWDFTADRVNGNITLRAEWAQRGEVVINLMIGGEPVALETTYRVSLGDNFLSRLYDTNDAGEYVVRADYVRSNARTQTVDNQTYTLLGFYFDEELTQPLTAENAVFPDSGTRLDLYAEYLVGNFTVLSQERLSSGASLGTNSNWYLVTDIDFSDRNGDDAVWTALDSFSGTIYGNGHTITGFEVRSEVNRTNITPYRSLFGVMEGRVEDLTIQDVGFTVYTRMLLTTNKPEISIAFLANSFSGGAFEDVTLEGCTVRVVNATLTQPDRGFTYTLTEGGEVGNWVDANGSENSTVTGAATFTGEEQDASFGL